jgi:hypothetical protein
MLMDINMVFVTTGKAGLFCMGAILGCGGGFVNRNAFYKPVTSANAMTTPATLHAKLTQSLSSHFQPRM